MKRKKKRSKVAIIFARIVFAIVLLILIALLVVPIVLAFMQGWLWLSVYPVYAFLVLLNWSVWRSEK